MQNIHVPVAGTVTGLAMAQAVNTGFDSLQQNIGGVLSKSVAGGADVALSAGDANYGVITLTGALTADINVIVPTASMQWIFNNQTTGAFKLTVKTAAGTGMPVKQGSQAHLWCDATNVLPGGMSPAAIQSQLNTAFTSAGAAPAYTVAADPAILALTANQRLRVKFHAANAGVAATLAANGLAAASLKQYDSAGNKIDPIIAANQLADVEYDGAAWVILDPLPAGATTPGIFYKKDAQSVAFTKTGAGTLSVKAGTVIDVFGVTLNLAAATAVAMPTLSAGTDYAIYACQDGTVRADSSFTNPTGYTTANSRLIGGFHYGLVAPGTTLAGGSFNTIGSVDTGGMVWVQGDVDNIAGINKFSLWDLKWRANVSDLRGQKGFVLTDAGNWVAIYYASSNPDANGLSKYNTDVASGTVLPKIPATMGGNGTLTYADFNWWRASEMARAYGARLLTDAEANIAFFGVTENQSLGGAASTIPLTTRQAGYTSKYGVEQATGHHWTWGDDSSGTTASGYVANGGRGQSYASGTTKVLLSGYRVSAASSGSRASFWFYGPTNSNWDVGLRAACDHLMLA